MKKFLIIGACVVLSACTGFSGKQPVTTSKLACLRDVTGNIIGIVSTNLSIASTDTSTNASKAVSAATQFAMTSALDPNCATALTEVLNGAASPATSVYNGPVVTAPVTIPVNPPSLPVSK